MGAVVLKTIPRQTQERMMPNTIGMDFQVVRVMAHDVPVKVMLWDQPAGKERFRVNTSFYFRRTLGVVECKLHVYTH